MTSLLRPRLKLSVSLWSADLSNIAQDMMRVDDYADVYHIDVCDGTYANRLLFFPDLVAAVRPFTRRPFEVHLITDRPERWIDSFAEAGANRIIFYPDATGDPESLIDQICQKGLEVGISLSPTQAPNLIEPWLDKLDCVVVMGTSIDVKGIDDLAVGTCEKIETLVQHRASANLPFEIEADGAIRRHTVPQLRLAGVDIVVPGSLIFKGDPNETAQWLKSL